MPVRYVTYQQIDKIKWDACIKRAHNSLIYAYCFYLDAMATYWDALVLDDYAAVMPLTWNKKFGINYLYQPPFMQQLGIFGSAPLKQEVQQLFVAAAMQCFRFAEIFVNFPTVRPQPNFVLPLQQPYPVLKQGYKTDLLKNLKHAEKFSLHYKATDDIVTAVDLFQAYYAAKTPHVKQRDYEQFLKVCETAKHNGMLQIRMVVDDNEVTLAIALLLKDNKRLYNIMSTVTVAGRQCEANHYLFDQVIQEFCAQQIVLDFEGSSIPGIAGFYQKFGAVNEPYFLLRYNQLPWPLKYFK